MPEPSDLQFEHATYDDAPGASARQTVTCAMCNRAVGTEYWQWLGRVTCGDCRLKVHALEAGARSPQTFARAAVLAGATALGCGVGYAVFVGATKIQFALITIGIGYVVASAVRKATGNVSGRRYQVLAVVLTYMAGAMGYGPRVWRDAHDPGGEPSSLDGDAAPSSLLVEGALLSGRVMVAPLRAATEDPLGLLIIGLGLAEAWRRSRPALMDVTGPFRVAPGAAGAPPP